jgi:two-component system, NtrC family, response regulator PilR
MSQALALIVDDESDILELLEITLGRMQVDCVQAADLRQAYGALEGHAFDLCLTDMRLPDGDGISLVQRIAERHPHLPVAVITAHGSMQTAIEAMKAGAFDFVSKPVDLQILRRLVGTALRLRAPAAGARGAASPLLGKSSAIEHIRRLGAKLARSQAPVYISGESGTGKELVARLIHDQGPRAEGRFVPVNCGAIPHDLVESELFGHHKGSFTGAVANKEGLFQAAHGGTLFLDEVADLPPDIQVKLLRAIQEKAVRPLGGREEIPVDVRIISATHRSLPDLVAQGAFRQDLFYRIHVIELPIPPLRERREDIPLLAEHFLTRIAHHSRCAKPRIERAALRRLLEYGFPGNVRELENTLERAVALCENGVILAEDLHLPEHQPPATELGEPTVGGSQPLEHYLGDVEKQAILKALEETRWNRTAAARKLGMTLRSLRYRLAKLGIE